MTFGPLIINEQIIFNADSFELKSIDGTGETVVLNAPTARCLQLLIEKKDEVVSRDDFLEQVWLARGIVVSQNTFYQNISLLRKSLKICGLTVDIIVTVRRKGFTLAPSTQLHPLVEVKEEVKEELKTEAYPEASAGEEKVTLPATLSATERARKNEVTHKSSDSLLKMARWLVLLLIFLIILEVASLILSH